MKKRKKKHTSECDPNNYNSQVFAELITACFELDRERQKRNKNFGVI